MNLVVTVDYRFSRTPDGAIWTQTTFPYSFWQRYLEVFDSVCVIARVGEIPSVSPNWQRADGERVSFAAIPYYVGLVQYLQKANQVQQAIKNAINETDAIILRVHSNIANVIEPWLNSTGHPYGLEVIGDPYDVFSPGSVRHPLRPFFRWWFTHKLKAQCAKASAISYVTKEALQRRYIPNNKGYSIYYSDVVLAENSSLELSEQKFISRLSQNKSQKITLITIASLELLYKAPDVLIDAAATCIQQGLNLELVIVGDGKYRKELEARSAKLGIKEQVIFCGQLPAGKAVFEQLDRANVFVLPSRQEGLPRAMIEAMSRGLPCIGSSVGGIPELLSSEDIVPPNDVVALAAKIKEVVTDFERMLRMSRRNLETSKEYKEEYLQKRRISFYRYLKEDTERWLSANNISSTN